MTPKDRRAAESALALNLNAGLRYLRHAIAVVTTNGGNIAGAAESAQIAADRLAAAAGIRERLDQLDQGNDHATT